MSNCRTGYAPSNLKNSRHVRMLFTALSTCFLLACGHVAVPPQSKAAFPAVPAGDTVDTYFGTRVADPYRALEDLKAPSTVAWMRAAADHADATLNRIPGRSAMLARLNALESGSTAKIGRVIRLEGELYVYERRGVTDNQYSIVMRRGLNGAESTLVNPALLSAARGGVPVAVNFFSVSPNGQTLAYGASEGGSEAASLQLLNMQTLQPIGEPITRADFGVARWSPDSKLFAFNRLTEATADPKTKYDNSAVWLVPMDGGWAKAREILGPSTPLAPAPAMRPGEAPTVLFTPDGRWLMAFLEDGVNRDSRMLIAPASSLEKGTPTWSQRIASTDKIIDFAYGNGTLYASTYQDAPRYRVIAAPIDQFSAATARTVVAASDRVVGTLAAARDGLYFDAREGNAKQLWKLPYGADAKAQQVALPLNGSFSLRRGGGVWAANALIDGVLIALEDWTHAPKLYAVSANGKVEDTGLQTVGSFDAPGDIITTEVLVTSHDGAQVPLSIIHRKGLKLDGRNPTLLQGYGAYGSTWEARFDASRLAWLEQGGVIAMANPRGSGVFGQAWYEAGKQATKPNTWRDMVACAEHLLAQRYASPATLAIEGGSAGGITSGRAATERPDLFVAVVPRVGVLDAVRMELTPNGPGNIPEFGTHTTESGFKALLAMSTYHHIQPGTRYPAVMLPHGVNDPRVDVWQSSKTAARFAAVSASIPNGRPVLLRLDYEAGHGVGSTKAQRLGGMYSFLLWQMGVGGFQP
jgi:prolyl oligopeptidase